MAVPGRRNKEHIVTPGRFRSGRGDIAMSATGGLHSSANGTESPRSRDIVGHGIVAHMISSTKSELKNVTRHTGHGRTFKAACRVLGQTSRTSSRHEPVASEPR